MTSKTLSQSKTFWVNMIVIVIAALVGVAECDVIAVYPWIIPWVAGVIGALNIVLRLFTKLPIVQ